MKKIFKKPFFDLRFLFLVGLLLSVFSVCSLGQPPLPIPVNYYVPTIDVAQYALHQGDSRSANLIE